jgi:pimeloyl-ACP methyl ester carboxylesterase
MANFVLIHGTTQGPAGWDRLIRELEGRGHHAIAVDLAASEAASIAELTEIAKSQVPDDFHAPVVVAHSGTGPLIPEIGRAVGARHGVWLAALVPSQHLPLREEISSSPTEIFNPEWVGQDPTADPLLASYFLFHDCDLETLRWAVTTLRLFALSFLYSSPLPTLAEFPSTYVVGSQDRVIRPTWSRRAAQSRLTTDVVEVASGHCPHVSQAAAIAKILVGLPGTAAARALV